MNVSRVSVALALVLLPGCTKPSSDAERAGRARSGEVSPLALRVRVTKPSRRDLAVGTALVGTLRPFNHAVLAARMAGIVEEVAVDRGDRVEQKRLLCKIRVPGLEEQLAAARAGGRVAAADVKSQQEIAERTRRAAEAHAAAVAGQELALADQRKDAAEARLGSARAEASRVGALLGDTRIVAPFDGVVLTRWVDPGSSIEAGQKLLEVADIRRLRLVVDVPERDVSLVKEGAPVDVTVPALDGKRLEAKVSRFAPAVDPVTRMLRVEVDVRNDGELMAGLEARLTFRGGDAREVLTLPAEALVLRREGPAVFVAKDGKAVLVPIETGYDDGAVFEVRKGLEGAEDVILGGGGLLADGAAVEVAR